MVKLPELDRLVPDAHPLRGEVAVLKVNQRFSDHVVPENIVVVPCLN